MTPPKYPQQEKLSGCKENATEYYRVSFIFITYTLNWVKNCLSHKPKLERNELCDTKQVLAPGNQHTIRHII